MHKNYPLHVCSSQFLLTMVRAEIINCEISLRVFLLHFHVLPLNWDCCVQKCRLVEGL